MTKDYDENELAQEELDQLKHMIHETATHLRNLRMEFKEKKFAQLKAAIEARSMADKMIEEEMRKLREEFPATVSNLGWVSTPPFTIRY